MHPTCALVMHVKYGSNLSTRDLQKLVQALPQYSELIDKLSLHVEEKSIELFGRLDLENLGSWSRNLFFGDAGLKDVIKSFTVKEDITPENKLRLLMTVASIYPEKFEGCNDVEMLAKLTADDMAAVNNMRLLGGSSE